MSETERPSSGRGFAGEESRLTNETTSTAVPKQKMGREKRPTSLQHETTNKTACRAEEACIGMYRRQRSAWAAGVDQTHMKLKPLNGTSGLSRRRIMTLMPFLSIAVLTALRMRYRLAQF